MLNEQMDSVVLVKGWKKGANWSFPRGKINKDEPDLDCAVREVYEETGYDIKTAGLVGNEKETKYIEITMREQHMRLYVFRGVPMDTYFEPRTRKEISKVEWYKLSDLPTIRKKKQQQDGKGEDLAVNANKFYMVAPFLVPLKKWISAQKKLDKAKQLNGIATNSSVIEEESVHIVNHDAEEGTGFHPSNEDLQRLLDSLRQSAKPTKTSDLPEVSGLPVEPKDITAQLKSVLGVPSAQPAPYVTETVGANPSSTSKAENQKSNALLALLQGTPAAQAEKIPQTLLDQLIENPPPPASSPHPHHQQKRLSSLPPPPTFPFPATHNPSAIVSSPGNGQPVMVPQAPISPPRQPLLVRPIPPPQQPAQLVPRPLTLQQNHQTHPKRPIPKVSVKKLAVAPYQRTGDPQFAQHSQVPSNNAPSIPPASKLPPPKLTPQSSALLEIFKSGLPTKTPIANGDIRIPGKLEAQTISANSSTNATAMLDIIKSHEKTTSPAIQKKPETMQGPTSSSKPVQAQPKTPSVNANGIDRPKSEHHDMLLSLFRRPSNQATQAVKPAADLLKPSSEPVELSAQPMTPGHSRGPSRADAIPQEQVRKQARSGSAKAHKRPQQDSSKAHNAPVSATVNGPLNVTQFDMLAKASKEAKHAAPRNPHKKSPRKSPVTILARPSSSHAHPQAPPSLTDAHAATPRPEQPAAAVVAPKLQTLLSPVKDMPPTPNLKGHSAPPKPFHPQILRRPTHPEDPNELSPIQPLPSPKHTLLANRSTQPTGGHPKSLLSILTEPSPIISPTFTAPSSAIDPTNFISPLIEKPTPREQADAAFAKLTRDVQDHAAPAAAPSRTSSINAVVAGVGGKERATGDMKTAMPRTTPVDRKFLLGYLEGVANAGR